MNNVNETTAVAQPQKSMVRFSGPTGEIQIPGDGSKFLISRNSSGRYEVEEIATLGESDIFVKRDASGFARLVWKKVVLRLDKKEIAQIRGTWFPTVPGYNKLNQIAGVSPITPPTIISHGVEHSNPFVQYDAAGEKKRIIARKIAIGFSPIGNLVAIDTVRHYDLDAYYMRDLQNKAKKFPESAKYGIALVCAFDAEAIVMKKGKLSYARSSKTGKAYTFKPITGLEGIWIDPSHAEIIEVNEQHVQHQIYGDVMAQNICWRNALKAHPAIATANIMVANNVAEVMVFGYRHEIDRKQLTEIGTSIMNGEQVQGVEVKSDVSEIEPEEVEQEFDNVVDETTVDRGENPTLFNDEGAVKGAELISKIVALAKEKGVDAESISQRVMQSRLMNLTAEQANRILRIIEKTEKGTVS